ncbi:hypothetical protein SUGI_0560630 [Cryptomeria japonica]|nr:hypothetical protein SUGI_0560630 [Cryptomeria japonica]
MNATLILPELDTNSFWHDKSGFAGIYDVDHFINSLKYDVKVVQSLPEVPVTGKKKKKMKPFQLRSPRDAPPSWYETVALEKMKEHGAVYLTPFSHRLAEEIDNAEYQRLRCRVNYHALRFKEDVMKLSTSIVNRLRSEEEQAILRKYREQNFAEKRLVYSERRIIGKCPLTPEEVGLILNAMGFDNSTRIYLAPGELFGGQRFMKPLHALFPHLENRRTVTSAKDLAAVNADGRALLGPAVDYMVCLLSDIFMPTYDGLGNFANNLLGHRLYYGFRSTIQPDRKALAPIFIDLERSRNRNFEALVRLVMQKTPFGGPHKRIHPESFYTNPWPECFCQISTGSVEHKCPTIKFMEIVKNQYKWSGCVVH